MTDKEGITTKLETFRDFDTSELYNHPTGNYNRNELANFAIAINNIMSSVQEYSPSRSLLFGLFRRAGDKKLTACDEVKQLYQDDIQSIVKKCSTTKDFTLNADETLRLVEFYRTLYDKLFKPFAAADIAKLKDYDESGTRFMAVLRKFTVEQAGVPSFDFAFRNIKSGSSDPSKAYFRRPTGY